MDHRFSVDQEEEMLENARNQLRSNGLEPILRSNAGLFEMGDIFEAETVKGHKNYIMFMFIRHGNVYYVHGDKGKKVDAEKFKSLIDYGDLVPVPRHKADPEKLALSSLGMMAMANGLAFNDYLDQVFGTGKPSEVRA